MAKRTLIITGDKQLNRKLNALVSAKAKQINRSALRKAAKTVLEKVKSAVPTKTGTLRRSLTVRAGKRSRKGPSYRVTQKETKKKFYGSFLELGFTPAGKKKSEKVPARWIVRQAGKDAESEAVDLYRSEIAKMIEEA